ncbi:hypothetical protein D3C75_1221800 [compost metagenome]
MAISIIEFLKVIDVQHGNRIIHPQLHHILLQGPPGRKSGQLIGERHRIGILNDRGDQNDPRHAP